MRRQDRILRRVYRDLVFSIETAGRNINLLKAWASAPLGRLSQDELQDYIETIEEERRKDTLRLDMMRWRYPEHVEWDKEFAIFRSKL